MSIVSLALFVLACIPAVMIATLLFFRVERLGCLQRIGLGLIASALLLSHPGFPIAFRVLLFCGLTIHLWACFGPAVWRRLDQALDEALTFI